jgi:tripeptide aminopeptidase
MDAEISDALELMAIPGEPGKESGVACYLTDKLLAMGVGRDRIAHDGANGKSEIGGEVGNLIVRFEGHGRGPRRMMSTHMDTIPAAVGCRPRLEGQRVVNDSPGLALGSDARGACAVLLSAARALVEKEGDHPPWTLVFFIQEEIGLVGARWLDVEMLGSPRPAMGFNFDAYSAAEIFNAVIGTDRLHITVTGVASHTMAPEQGISAARIFIRAAAKMMEEGWHGQIKKPDGTGLANLGVLRGGTGSNVVMPELYGLFEARSHDREFRGRIIERWKAAIVQEVEQANGEAVHARGKAAVSFRPGPIYHPYALPPDAPVVAAASGAIRRLGLTPQLCTDDGGNDAAWIAAHGIPAVTLGYGGCYIHTPGEYLDVPEFKRCCQLARELVHMS